MKLVISACLLGDNCKYNGGNNYSERLQQFIKDNDATVIKVCPEVLGGLPTPRVPSEIVNEIVMNKEGVCVDLEFRTGAEKALKIVSKADPDLVVLQSRSPSCGVKEVYDGTFSGTKIPGSGIFASLLIDEGYKVIDIEDL
ncbi:DUF523 domain-containing protein [Butyrivibrio fibrisolvens]|uniref:DUF523 domain-containing protein n=1 Tax=Butyrivibrio fibrisolvens TaxID=831 RepID=UPI0003B57D68|nr:DUF523 domain-containing protein [Butyrivibrio fibrisolvens]